MEQPLTVALVDDDHFKDDLLTWDTCRRDTLARCGVVATGTTGLLRSDALELPVERMRRGPLGGDLQIGAIAGAGPVELSRQAEGGPGCGFTPRILPDAPKNWLTVAGTC